MQKLVKHPGLRYSMVRPEAIEALDRLLERHLHCHLVKQAKANQLTADEIKDSLTRTEFVLESNHMDVGITKCQQCGQPFAYCFYEYTSPDGDDDCWSFWIPIHDNEIEEIRTRKPLLKFIGEMVHNRPLICRHPNRSYFWAERGVPFIP